ncbi:MAG: 30S ribosomal protein S19 [Roseivirga sp.]
MPRSVKKGPYVAHHLQKKIDKANESGTNEKIKTWSRGSTITPPFVGHTITVHNGNKFIPVHVTEDMVGHKLGELAPTRTFKGHISKKNKGRK